jgi:hypothetical protein
VESSQSEKSTRERVSSDLQKALEDLRKAGENATGDVRSGIESAVTRIRDASGAASSGDLRGQLDSFRNWLQGATVDILDEIEKEVRKRREQLAGQGSSKSGSSTKSSSSKSGSSGKSSGAKSGSRSGSKSGSSS